MENYEKKYKEALGRARELQENSNGMILKKWLWGVFPELKESEDERIRKALKQGFFEYGNSFTTFGGIQVGDILAWIEKQGEQKSTLTTAPELPATTLSESCYREMFQGCEVKPKFHEGEWITNGCLTCKVLGVTGNSYELHLHNDDYCHFETDIQSVNKYYNLWTIADAKEGDVLTTDNFIFIFKSIDICNGVHYYCHYEISKHEDDSPRFGVALSQSLMGIVGSSFTHYKPATKEQCDLLFQKMKEAGYVWDANKKELKKMEAVSKESGMRS